MKPGFRDQRGAAGDALDPTDISIYRQRAGGVTSAHLLHGSANTIGGQAQIIKLRWGSDADGLRFEGALPTIKFALGENVKQSNWGEAFNKRYPQTRMGVQEILRDSFIAARAHAKKPERRPAASTRPAPEALVEVLDGRRPCMSTATARTIRPAHRPRSRFVPTFQHVLEGCWSPTNWPRSVPRRPSATRAYKMEVADDSVNAARWPARAWWCRSTPIPTSLPGDSNRGGQGGQVRRLTNGRARLGHPQSVRQLRVEGRVGAPNPAWMPISSSEREPVIDARPRRADLIDGRRYYDRDADAAERARIAGERERLSPGRCRSGSSIGREANAAARPQWSWTTTSPAIPRPAYHDGEALHVCTEDHQ